MRRRSNTFAAMKTMSICNRCLRAAAKASDHTSRITPVNRRHISASASKQPPKARQIHQSHQHKQPELDAGPRQTTGIPPYASPVVTNERMQQAETAQASNILLQPNNLFHPFTDSPSPQIRKRAAFMRQNAYCPHPDHQATRAALSPHDTESRKVGAVPPAHVRYECPDCGIPVSCSEDHFASDYESHLEICDSLREINEDDHDLHSGRVFTEFDWPGPQIDEAQVNMTNWDTLLYTRDFTAVNAARPMRQLTRLLTYPVTVASVLHELSPYTLKDRLTPEGLRSLSGELSCNSVTDDY